MIKERRKLKNTLTKNRNSSPIRDKITLSKKIKNDIKLAKESKWDKEIKEMENNKNAKRGWKNIKRVQTKKTKTPCKIIGTNNEIQKNNLEIATSFAEKLKNTFQPNISNDPLLEEHSLIWYNNNKFNLI